MRISDWSSDVCSSDLSTIVVYTSDQGFYLGEHGWFDKRFIYEESLRTPFLIQYPGHIRPGTRVAAPIQNIDYAPPFLALAGVIAPDTIQGRSLVPLFGGRAPADRSEARRVGKECASTCRSRWSP